MPVRVGVIGGSGYTGGELLRILLHHPDAQVVYVASRTQAGQPVAASHLPLLGLTELVYEPADPGSIATRCDVVFLAVPRGASMDVAAELCRLGVRVVDLGTDFRFRNPETYRYWYGADHRHPELLADAVYGLPEMNREAVRKARLVGNPGCYPTAVLLGVMPFIKAGCVDPADVVVTAMSGVSGAGSTPAPMYHFPECTENVQAYGVPGHRHTGEMEQGIAAMLGGGGQVSVSFVPHLVPMSRGIQATIHLRLTEKLTTADAIALMQEHYRFEPFVRVLGENRLPQTKVVAGSNFCDVTARSDPRTGRLIVLAAIDNLVKGAAGQAVQNMNLMFGLDEAAGLRSPGLYP
ncbi:MAG: N-acetyl-gamma-glutamyl-phosphate reductase [Firmicutes bacterium]|nr:N-acetyl-gamma-glutamyl-phosphate reductase [Bacillota bacterium]